MHAARNSITTNHGHCRLPAAAKTGASQKERPLKTVDSPATIVPQFELQNHGSLFLLRPLTPAAKEWMRDHLPEDSPETQFWGEAIVIEPRCLEPIIEGILADGLVLR
jgi:hypothetical protein